MSESADDPDDYRWKGDTWWVADRDCPECEGTVGSNGKMHTCYDCEWWEPVVTDRDEPKGS